MGIAIVVRYIHQILFSVNVGLLFLLARSWNIFPLLERTKYLFTGRWGLSNHAAGVPAFYLLALASAACFFLLLQFLKKTSVFDPILRIAGGIAAIAGVPACRFYPAFASYIRTGYLPWEAGSVLSFLELVIAAACVVAYFYWRLSVLTWVAVLLFTLHYSLWGWIYWQSTSSDPNVLVFPIVGFCSSLAWFVYVSRITQGWISEMHA